MDVRNHREDKDHLKEDIFANWAELFGRKLQIPMPQVAKIPTRNYIEKGRCNLGQVDQMQEIRYKCFRQRQKGYKTSQNPYKNVINLHKIHKSHLKRDYSKEPYTSNGHYRNRH